MRHPQEALFTFPQKDPCTSIDVAAHKTTGGAVREQMKAPAIGVGEIIVRPAFKPYHAGLR